jgi:putative nucleotidyltransferase with HDIG domain
MDAAESGAARLLCVDDEEMVLGVYCRALSPVYELTHCRQGDEAVEQVRSAVAEARPFAVAFLDVRMPPGPDGVQAAEQIRSLDPHIEIVIVSAMSDLSPSEIAERVPPPHKLLYLQKPFDLVEIIQFAASLSAKWQSERSERQLMRNMEALVTQRTQDLAQANEKLARTLLELRKTFGGIVQVLTATLETRDPYTAGHQSRVSDLARTMATEMGLGQERVEGLRVAGVVHDLGKISIPSEILSKPGRLTEIEFGLIKTHSQVGYELLQPIDFPWPVAEIVRQHHEKVDGSGYPQGLKGETILLEARILAVADVVEAMASHRPYRPALGVDKALEEIEEYRGLLYDVAAVEACLSVFRSKRYRFPGLKGEVRQDR